MKFKKLKRESNELLEERDEGKTPKLGKVKKILSSLEEKKAHYEAKLRSEMSEKDRHVLEVKLKVVSIQIEKLRTMVGENP